MNYNTWTTADGQEIKISDMTINHIKNCINMIKRSQFENKIDLYEELPEPPIKYVVDYNLYKPYLHVFKEELKKRSVNNKHENI